MTKLLNLLFHSKNAQNEEKNEGNKSENEKKNDDNKENEGKKYEIEINNDVYAEIEREKSGNETNNEYNEEKKTIILDSSSFELHEIYKAIYKQHTNLSMQVYLFTNKQKLSIINEQNILRSLFLRFAEYCFSKQIYKDIDYVKYKMDEIILEYIKPMYDIKLRESVLILLVNIFIYDQTFDFVNDYINGNIISQLKEIIDRNEASLQFPAFKLLTCLSSQYEQTRNLILELFTKDLDLETCLKRDYSLETKKQIMKLIESFSLFHIDDRDVFNNILKLINETIQIISKKHYLRILISFTNDEDNIQSICGIPDVFSFLSSMFLEFQSYQEINEEDGKILNLALQLLNILSYTNDGVILSNTEYDKTVTNILHFIQNENKEISINAMQALSNIICNQANHNSQTLNLVSDEFYQGENLKFLYDTIINSMGKKKLEAVMLATNIIRSANSKHIIACIQNFSDDPNDEYTNFITEFVDSIDSGDRNVIIAVISAISHLIHYDEKVNSERSKKIFIDAGGKEKIEELIDSDDQKISHIATSFQSAYLAKKEPRRCKLKLGFDHL